MKGIEVGKSYSGRKVLEINGMHVKYAYGNIEGDCPIYIFIRRWVNA